MCNQCEKYKKEKYNFCPVCGEKLEKYAFIPCFQFPYPTTFKRNKTILRNKRSFIYKE